MKRKLEAVVIGVMLCALLALAAAAFYAYGRENSQYLLKNAHASLESLAREQSAALTEELNSVARITDSLASVLSREDDSRSATRLLVGVMQSTAFTSVGMVKEDGSAVSVGAPYSLPPEVDSASHEKSGVYYDQQQDQDILMFASPIQGGGYVYACYPSSCLRSLSLTQNVMESGFSFIARGDGHILLRSQSESMVNIMDNAFTFYQDVVAQEGSVDRIEEDMAKGKSGMMVYHYGNQYHYASYAPLGINGWYLFTVADGRQITSQQSWMTQGLWRLGIIMLVLYCVIILLAIWQLMRSRQTADRLKNELEESQILRRRVHEMSYTILFEADPVTGEMQFNQAFERQLGHKPRVTNLNDFQKDDCPLPLEQAQAWRRLAREMKRGLPKSHMSVQMDHANNQRIWYRVSFETLYNREKTAPLRILGRMANIEWQEQEQDRNMASGGQDSLTGLMGHSAFMQRAAGQIRQDGAGALVVVDIDGFKSARSAQGSYQGDQLLVNMSQVLRAAFTEKDLLGRLGSDTFAVLITEAVTAREAGQRCRLLCSAFKEKTGCTCSVGIAMCEGKNQSATELSRQADMALYRAKLAGKERYEFYQHPREEKSAAAPQSGDINLAINRCAVALLTCDALPVGIDQALEEIGRYYRADRAFIMQKDNGGNRVRETYSWCAPGVEAGDAVTLSLDKNSALYKALEGRHSLSIPRVQADTVTDEALLKTLWQRQATSAYAVPAGKQGAEEGFVAIENPREHVGNVTLLKQAAACLFSALNKYSK